MRSKDIFAGAFALLMTSVLAQAAQVTGTVTNKTTGKPAAGDTVAMLDVQTGMTEVDHATTDAQGHYSLNGPGAGPYLIRVTHQGAGYFIAAPPGASSAPGAGDVSVYDVAAKVKGVHIEADVIEVESDNGQLKVNERYFVHNQSSPPITQWSPKSFEIVLPPDAVVSDTGAQRPSGLPTEAKLDPAGEKGHYTFNFPIEPDNTDKDTMFQVSYTVPYSGKLDFKAMVTLPADNFAVLLPKAMTFAPGSGMDFQPVMEDPNVQTFLVKNAEPDKLIDFTISGTGSIPREQQNSGTQASDASGGQSSTAAPGTTPGGGIGEPINTPDPLSKYKWWILGGLGLLLAAAAAFLLRRPPAGAVVAAPLAAAAVATSATPAAKQTLLLSALKDELFALESEKIAGTLSGADYAEQKTALETVLKRALKK